METKRNVYLKMKTLEEARDILFSHFSVSPLLPGETIPVPEALGRILAEPVFANFSSPNFHAAAMDGIAVKASDTFGASETNPKSLRIGPDARFLNTGHVMPENTDAVIMIENINMPDEDHVVIEAPAFPWQNVRKMGEDIVATELLFTQNHQVTPACIGALLSGGVFSVRVRRKPRILVIPTGSELLDWQDFDPETFKPGQVLESNSYVLGKLLETCGAEFEKHDKIQDNLTEIRKAVKQAVNHDHDMVLILGGSSAGSEDFAKGVISDLGEVLVHGVTIMPGKPVLIGDIDSKPVFGIPGYPVSAIIAFEQFVRPLVLKMLGQAEPQPQTLPVVTARKVASKIGVEEFVRVKLGEVDGKIVASLLPRGAGSITSITEADGIIRIPNQVEGFHEGQEIKAELLRPRQSIHNTIVAVGSHDNTLDVLQDQLKRDHSHLTLSSSHVGSMGGIMALKKRGCHLAGSHLLDTDDGSYNISYIKKYLPGMRVRGVNLVLRDQGLILARGNPKSIKGLDDLKRGDIRIINRQTGSGTRILLDYKLAQLGMDATDIMGYHDEEYTHMAVAVSVLSGAADVGLGIYAAAKALDLDFIPVITEQYDLIIPHAHFDSDNMQILLETIRTDVFKKRVEALGGYSTEKTGEVIL